MYLLKEIGALWANTPMGQRPSTREPREDDDSQRAKAGQAKQWFVPGSRMDRTWRWQVPVSQDQHPQNGSTGTWLTLCLFSV